MKIPTNSVIELAPGETLPGYEKLRPVPEKYINEMKMLIDRLNRSGPSVSMFLGLKQIYALLSRFNKDYVSTFTTCRKGCNSCCSMDVQLTPFEAQYIYYSANIIPRDSALTTGHKSCCPFLSGKGTCSIYNYRPLLCRTYHVLTDPDLCSKADAEVMQYGAHSANMGNFVYHTAARWIYHQTQHNVGQLVFRDIRDYFPYDRGHIQSFLSSNPPKSPC